MCLFVWIHILINMEYLYFKINLAECYVVLFLLLRCPNIMIVIFMLYESQKLGCFVPRRQLKDVFWPDSRTQGPFICQKWLMCRLQTRPLTEALKHTRGLTTLRPSLSRTEPTSARCTAACCCRHFPLRFYSYFLLFIYLRVSPGRRGLMDGLVLTCPIV